MRRKIVSRFFTHSLFVIPYEHPPSKGLERLSKACTALCTCAAVMRKKKRLAPISKQHEGERKVTVLQTRNVYDISVRMLTKPNQVIRNLIIMRFNWFEVKQFKLKPSKNPKRTFSFFVRGECNRFCVQQRHLSGQQAELLRERARRTRLSALTHTRLFQYTESKQEIEGFSCKLFWQPLAQWAQSYDLETSKD